MSYKQLTNVKIINILNNIPDEEILAANALLAGEERKNLLKILNSNTTEEAVSYINKKETFTLLAEKAKEKCQEYTKRNGSEITVETLIFASGERELGRSKGWKL